MLDPADMPLPPLREDLRLSEAAHGSDGEPAWVIQDTVINRFYRIGWLEFECLLRWGQSARQICAQIAERTSLKPDVEQVLDFRQFLEQHQLLRAGPAALEHLQAKSEESTWLSWNWWLHHYLFFRIPLLRPQVPLQRLARALGWLFHPITGLLVLGLSLLGIVLVLQQWDVFTHAVVESFSTEGLFSFALALIVAKTLHELGHALVATRLGLRVGHMGIAFVVLWPMLYTDTGESWKLSRSRQRLAIASAGIVTELSLAGLSTLGWALCDPGALRNALLYLATTSWLLSLALNASPFMRFDGYFILSDLLDFPNLHERSSALARVTLRRNLLGLQEDWPESFPTGQRRLLVTFAIVTWLYRLVLFLGIALAVYLFFFKLLGIILFMVELSWFIALPVVRELGHWWTRRAAIPRLRKVVFYAVLGLILIGLAIPWRTQIGAVGVARAEHQLRVYAPYPARLQSIHPAGPVQAGQTLAVLDEPDIASRLQSSEANARSYEARLSGLIADPGGLAEDAATRERLNVQFEEARAARSEIARLNLQTPFAGVWLDVNPDWKPGQWISRQEPLGILVDPRSWQVDAYVAQDQVHRLSVGDHVRFYPDGQVTPISGRVLAIGSTRASQLSHRMLSSQFGGPVQTTSQEHSLAPAAALFQVLIQLDQATPSLRETRGHLKIEGERRSLLGDGATYVLAVLMRESGF
ncbi:MULTISPECIES: HlyD family efflux transporter periplasmic adaptor subunit [Pseudomonas]|uniref:HlyD family efflux transporter periplasmic adaptor subunit n=1 Tax=Pseudomonas aphyarum TaxID=2942629 RepID=A0ABT5PQ89_9PSED|nr:HlyD family efflux transporter periplasmic adaptor subunit [Pseudomonas aphyarum]MDD0971104.1 HlyD family efflux transporter periplasmic adaptor subunit [Pseudomonas aphyarum]MDD1125930.1 HlyD family efflux transporter periplasmic adaptor subunit [Pseudomonas aphyarum]